jgi:beta-lactam-binding protein with PASTA domain
MKTKPKIPDKEFDTVKTFREIKEKIAKDLTGMTFEQIKAYLKANSIKFQEQ